ncbi:MAG: [protein-PII] uridylyltransferase, partial [Gammaproteobacteria bacterium]
MAPLFKELGNFSVGGPGDPSLIPAELGSIAQTLEAAVDPAGRLNAFRWALNSIDNYLRRAFYSGYSVDKLVRLRARMMDRILAEAWQQHAPIADGRLALVAAGGYGRGELHPGSDIDITILVLPRMNRGLCRALESLVTFLWDIGLDLGHSVRTIGQCKIEAKSDLSIATNLMEARFLRGDRKLYQEMRDVTGPRSIWPPRKFFEAKCEEQLARHRRFNDTAENLEPHIKEGPGGLRDMHTIAWVAKRHFGAETLQELVQHQFITTEEHRVLEAGQSFLWRVRMALHLLAGKREDRLLFDYQRNVAREFGYGKDTDGQLGVERFMKMYYRTAMEIDRLNELLLALFREAILEQHKKEPVRSLNQRFQTRNRFIEVRDERVFAKQPVALLEVFLLMQRDSNIQGVRASTIRLIRDHRYLIDQKFRKDIRARSLFMEILRQPACFGAGLQRMHRYGVLGAYLPVFEAVTGLMQFDLFHVFTVDAHTLTVVENVCRYNDPNCAQELPLCHQIVNQIPKIELLYIAGLFHDIAKGRGGNHSDIGAQEAQAFCRHHGLGAFDTRLVSWLVRNHLLLSRTSQREDIGDPEVVNSFARRVGDKLHLDYLYLLTVADIRGTNPSLWNDWKETLLTGLYQNTLQALRRGVENPMEKKERIAEVQGEVLAVLCILDIPKAPIIALWEDLGEDYFVRYWPDEIAWQTRCILGDTQQPLPLVIMRPRTPRGGTEVFIYTRDEEHVFPATTRALDRMGLNIFDARIITTANGYTLDTYIVLDAATNQPIVDKRRLEDIADTLKRYLSNSQMRTTTVNRSPSRWLKSFHRAPDVSFKQDPVYNRTVLELVATDRPGLLSEIAAA